MPAATLKVLIVLTSNAAMGPGGPPTGFWLEEFTTPYYAFVDAGAFIEIASIAGGPAPIDPRSLETSGLVLASVDRYRHDPALHAALEATIPIARVASNDYDVVFLPGGHGTMWDLPGSNALAGLVAHTLARGTIVAAVCHGPAGLVSARFPDGQSVVAGRRVSAFTNAEERAVKLDSAVPFLLEDRLRALGANFESGQDFKSFAIVDGNLVTGQNPASSARVAELAIAAARGR